MPNNFAVLNQTKCRLPRLPIWAIKEDILGRDYSLSLAFISPAKSKTLNFQYRQKNTPTNILSFPLSKKEGEILICPSVARKEAKLFNRTFREFLGLLVIHGLLHLKGYEHSSTMDKAEKKYDQKYLGRH